MNPLRLHTRLHAHRPRYADVVATLALLLAMGGTAYAATSLAPGSVGTKQLKDHAVTAGKLGHGAVTTSKYAYKSINQLAIQSGTIVHTLLGDDSINSDNVAADTLSLADLVGTDYMHNIGFSIPANDCGTLNLTVPGAQLAQLVLFSFVGATAVPDTAAFGSAKVTAAGKVAIPVCNVGATHISVTHVGIRVATLG